MRSYKEFKEFLLHKYKEDASDTIIGAKYISWSKLEKEDKVRLEKVFSLNIGSDSVGYCLGNYWAEDYPIDFNVYPNSGCDIYIDKQSENYYLVYLECGGHVPEERCRLIQTGLIKYISQEA